jgi:hypothetical protein
MAISMSKSPLKIQVRILAGDREGCYVSVGLCFEKVPMRKDSLPNPHG